MANYRYQITIQTTPEEEAIIEAGLTKASAGVPPRNYKPITVIVHDETGKMIGGLTGSTYWEHLNITLLWVDESLRGEGVGQSLVKQAELEAILRSCKNSVVDTYSFQALGFYEKLGYKVFGKLSNFPTGEQRYYLSKSLL